MFNCDICIIWIGSNVLAWTSIRVGVGLIITIIKLCEYTSVLSISYIFKPIVMDIFKLVLSNSDETIASYSLEPYIAKLLITREQLI